jgi:uncharacterized protein involved in exopolysaccharide biosynthesis
MALVFVGMMGAVTAGVLLMPRAYRSEAKLFVRLGRENVTLDPTTTLGEAPVVAVPQSRENDINSIIEILKSRVVAEKVVDAVGPRAVLGYAPLPGKVPLAVAGAPGGAAAGAEDGVTPPAAPLRLPGPSEDRDNALVRLAGGLTVEAVKKSNVIRISYDAPSPEVAQAVVASLTDSYLDLHSRLNRTSGATRFFAEQTDRLRSEVARYEEELCALKNETGLLSPDGQRELLAGRLGRLQEEVGENAGAIAAAEVEVRLLREKVAGTSPTQVTAQTTGFPNQAADAMRALLYGVQLKELELGERQGSRNPDFMATRQQTAAAKSLLHDEEGERAQVTTGPNRLYEETRLALLKAEPALASLRARREALQKQLAQQQEEGKTLNANTLRVARLERELALRQAQYRKYVESQEQARIDQSMESERICNINVVQPATYEARPVSLRRALILGLGLCFSLLGSVAVVWLAEQVGRPAQTPPAQSSLPGTA